ncbi:MAG TPA: carboxypeptidase-like regulatory domain-containing protein [Polyangia bacterium]|jgi:hypothetical protein
MRRTPAPGALLLAAVGALLLGACLDPIPPGMLTPGQGTLRGLVRRRCGTQPLIAGAKIAVDGVVRAQTDAAGAYRVDGIDAAGAHTVTAEAPGYIYTETIVRVTPGEVFDWNFALEQPGDDRQPVLLDVLFVVDDGPDMKAAQDELLAAFPAFAARLEAGSINLQLGVVTTDMGAGDGAILTCTPGGDEGRLQVHGRGETCSRASLITGAVPYLHLIQGAGGADRKTNFTGTLADAFACYAPVGTGGCRFGMPLKAMARVLDPHNEDTVGFVRAGATLLVIVVTRADDCSAPDDTGLFDPFQTGVDTRLGPLGRYRCFEFGATCGGAPPGRTPGPRASCRPGAPDPDPAYQLTPLDGYRDLLRDWHGGRAILGVIAGPEAPVEIATDVDGHPNLLNSCGTAATGATPALRLAALATDPELAQTNRASVCGNYAADGDLALWAQQALDLAVAARSCE